MNIAGYEDLIAVGLFLIALAYMSVSDKFDSFTFRGKGDDK